MPKKILLHGGNTMGTFRKFGLSLILCSSLAFGATMDGTTTTTTPPSPPSTTSTTTEKVVPEIGITSKKKVVESQVYNFDGLDGDFEHKARTYKGKIPGTDREYTKNVDTYKSTDGLTNITKSEDGTVKVTKTAAIDLSSVKLVSDGADGQSVTMNGKIYKVSKVKENKDGSVRYYVKGGYVDMKADGSAAKKASYKTSSTYKAKAMAQ